MQSFIKIYSKLYHLKKNSGRHVPEPPTYKRVQLAPSQHKLDPPPPLANPASTYVQEPPPPPPSIST